MLPTRMSAEDRQQFVARSLTDNDTFTIEADSASAARLELLDKLGFAVNFNPSGNLEVLDADTGSFIVELPSDGVSVERCLTDLILTQGWTLDDGIDLIGGSLGSGFSEDTN